MKLESELESFRKTFPLTKVFVESTYMVYRVRRGLAKAVAEEANRLIEDLGLALTAIPTSLSTNDSFYVKSSEVEL